MELPLAPQTRSLTADAAVRLVQRARTILARTGSQETSLDHAVAMVNAHRPGVRIANFANELTLHDGADAQAVAREVLDHFADAGAPCLELASAALDWPAPLARAAGDAGFQPVTKAVWTMQAYQPSTRPHDASLQIIPGRAAYAELRRLFDAQARRDHHADDQLAADLADAWIDQLDEPRLDLLMGRRHGQPVAVAGMLTLGQDGVLVPVWVHPDARGAGVGSAMLHAVIELCQRSQFEQVLIERSVDCYSLPMYARAGFREHARSIRYRLPTPKQA